MTGIKPPLLRPPMQVPRARARRRCPRPAALQRVRPLSASWTFSASRCSSTTRLSSSASTTRTRHCSSSSTSLSSSLEQDEYESQGIQWSFIDFPDNQACLDLIEGKPVGLLALLDEQCLFPKGNDESLASKLYDHLEGTERFSASRPQKVKREFVIAHYAGEVVYATAGFVTKNKDELYQEGLVLLRSSPDPLVRELFPPEVEQSPAEKSKKRKSALQATTVGSQFRAQLASLLQTIKATAPHYVRCLKPNDDNVPDKLVRPRLVDQLRYGGVLEAVKVARAGYPTRLTLGDFVARYFMLAPTGITAASGRTSDAAAARRAVETVIGVLGLTHGEHYQIGRTKVFLRKGAYEKIETRRSRRLAQAAVIIQAQGRRLYFTRQLAATRKANSLVQRVVRGFLGRRKARHAREERSAVKIAAVARMYIARRALVRQRRAAKLVQAVFRGMQGRERARKYKDICAATVVQAMVRGRMLRKAYVRQRSAAVRAQCAWRAKSARTTLKRLRVEAREVGSLQDRILELQARVKQPEGELAEERKKNAALGVAGEAVPAMTQVAAQRVGDDGDSELVSLRQELARERARYDQRVRDLESALAAEKARSNALLANAGAQASEAALPFLHRRVQRARSRCIRRRKPRSSARGSRCSSASSLPNANDRTRAARVGAPRRHEGAHQRRLSGNPRRQLPLLWTMCLALMKRRH